jgi:tetraacyldisaccharide-1-P 4'-kinase
LHIVKSLRYPDHHAYSREDVEAVREACATSTLVTTEKDWAKLVDLNMRGSDVCLARLRLRLVGEGVYGQITKPRA